MVIPAIQSFLNPMYLIAAALGAAFMLPLIEKAGKSAARITVLIIAGIFAVVPLLWMMYWIAELGFAAAFAAAPLVVETIGFSAPYSISFRVGMQEAVILTMVNSIALFGGGFSFLRKNPYWSGKKLVLFLTLLIGVNGLILTRDLFNVFVFLEITSISTYALIASNGKRNAFEAGFKYIIAGSIASAFFIIGVIYLYRFTGTLSLDQMISMKRAGVPGVFGEVGAEQSGVLGFVGIGGAAAALFLIMTALLIELKPFPANGWAMDVYEAADPSISALISALAASGVLTVFYHISHLLPQSMLQLALISGGLTFLFSQFIGLRQTKVRRMLGYSSSAQIGLLILIIGLRLPVETYGKSLSAHFPGLHIPFDFGPSISLMLIFLVLLGSHIFSKAGLFWITDLLRSVETVNSMDRISTVRVAGRSVQASKLLLVVLLGLLTAALIGLPPFPTFWAKWFLLSFLAQAQQWTIMVIILAGSLMEAAYLFRWFITQVRNEADPGTVQTEVIPPDTAIESPQTGTVSSAAGKKAVSRARGMLIAQAAPADPAPPKGTDQNSAAAAANLSSESSGAEGSSAATVSHASSVSNNAAVLSPLAAAAILLAVGTALGAFFFTLTAELLLLIPVGILLLGVLFDLLLIPFRLQLFISILGTAVYTYILIPQLQALEGGWGIRSIFGVIFLIGALVQMVVLFQRKGRHPGLASLLTALIFSLGNLLAVETRLGLFFTWEMMTVTSFLLILRGKRASGAGFRYFMFSMGGAYSILMALMLMPGFAFFLQGQGSGISLTNPRQLGSMIMEISSYPLIAGVLLAAGLLIKMGSLGFHLWLPSAYAEADDDITPFLSSILSKAGLFLFFITAGLYIFPMIPFSPARVLGWIGVLTALAGAFLALFQEDIKYTLAYSSMGQVGYMLLSFSLMTQLGWTNSLYLAVTHLLFKGMLFIAVAGVVRRTGTRLMYQMGGLISRMPFSFITVLIGIIALSGVPPLTGFGGKWMLYTALIEKGWYLDAAAAMFASGIAFLYLFRLIHSIFLGQLKTIHRDIKEAPIWYLIPQAAGIIGIMIFSMYPNLLIQPLQAATAPYFTGALTGTFNWDGYTVISTLGYWNGNAVMYVTMGVFIIPLLWLLLMQRKHTRKVGQLNIVYAAERPERPETTHYAYNFFAPYRSALGSFLTPWTSRFWNGVTHTVNVIGSSLRRIYTGNGQTYALHILLYTAILGLLLRGGI